MAGRPPGRKSRGRYRGLTGKISREKTIGEDGKEVASEYTQLQGMMREAQWKNKNITELYMPGSVFKLITASAGLDSGVMSTSQTFYCGGSPDRQ